jgi:ankyrin repeat domain-containing protein 50
MTRSVPFRIIRSTLDSLSNVQSLALKLLKSRKRPNYDIGKTLVESSKLFSRHSVDEYHFYAYIKSYWLQHVFYISEQEPVMYNLLFRLFKGKAVNMNAIDEDGRTSLSWAAGNGHETVVKLLLETGKVNVDSKNNYDRTSLSRATGNGHETVVKLLLEIGKVNADSKNDNNRTPLSWAAGNGHEAVVKLLLEIRKVNADSKINCDNRTPLS